MQGMSTAVASINVLAMFFARCTMALEFLRATRASARIEARCVAEAR